MPGEGLWLTEAPASRADFVFRCSFQNALSQISRQSALIFALATLGRGQTVFFSKGHRFGLRHSWICPSSPCEGPSEESLCVGRGVGTAGAGERWPCSQTLPRAQEPPQQTRMPAVASGHGCRERAQSYLFICLSVCCELYKKTCHFFKLN